MSALGWWVGVYKFSLFQPCKHSSLHFREVPRALGSGPSIPIQDDVIADGAKEVRANKKRGKTGGRIAGKKDLYLNDKINIVNSMRPEIERALLRKASGREFRALGANLLESLPHHANTCRLFFRAPPQPPSQLPIPPLPWLKFAMLRDRARTTEVRSHFSSSQ